MYKYIISGMSLSKFLFVFFTFLIGFSLNSQAQILAEDPNPPPAALALLTGDLLWDQFDPTLTSGVASQRFPDVGNSVIQSADDFEVPAGKIWSIEHINTRGAFFNGNPMNGPIPSVNIIFYDDNSGMPGNPIAACNYPSLPVADGNDPNISVDLISPCELGEGHYWVSVLPVMPFNPSGQWAWSGVNFTTLNQWQFQDPDGLTGSPCLTWGAGSTTCGVAVGSTFDLQFQLLGVEKLLVVISPIPTLTEWGLLTMAGVLGIVGYLVIRRRKAVA